MTPPEARPATQTDLNHIVAIHQQAFVGFFLTELGPRFLRRYYDLVLRSPAGVLWVVEAEDGSPVGFVAGSSDPTALYAELRDRKVQFGLAMLPTLLRRPWSVPRVLTNFRRTGDEVERPPAGVAELTSIGVCPTASGKGYGQALAKAFVAAARERGCQGVYLTTDAHGNDRVNDFYQRQGYRLTGTITAHGGRVLNKYLLDL